MIPSDAIFADLAARRPSNGEESVKVTGIGVKKSELYGKEIISAVAEVRWESSGEGAAS